MDQVHKWNPHLPKKTSTSVDFDALIAGIKSGNRVSIARALTLMEDQRSALREDKARLLSRLSSDFMTKTIGITGAPGVGKSTFIEHIGQSLTERGFQVAVLSIDPSSIKSGGSILGDKTRMQKLSQNEKAFIRPSANQNYHGGVARSTYFSKLVLEAASYDYVIIETVGVGQSEFDIYKMCDVFVLLVDPGAGDSLQGIKRGIMELTDMLFITKSHVQPEVAQRTKQSYQQALRLFHTKAHGLQPIVALHDSFDPEIVTNSTDSIISFLQKLNSSSYLKDLRKEQDLFQFKKLVERIDLENIPALDDERSDQSVERIRTGSSDIITEALRISTDA